MNNKGQALIFFVLILPLLLLLASYIVDNTYIAYNTNKLNQINKLIVKDAVINKMTKEEIKEYVEKNDKDIKIDFMFVSSDKVELTLKKEIKSLFGSIIGKDHYTLTSKESFDYTNDDFPPYQ